MERIELIEYGLNCPEIVISDTELIDCIQQLNDGEDLWYRDYDNTGEKCISLYKCITRTKLCGREVYVFSYQTDGDCQMVQDAKVVDANVVTTYDTDDPNLMEHCQELALLDAIQSFSEWHEYHGMMCIEKITFDKYINE